MAHTEGGVKQLGSKDEFDAALKANEKVAVEFSAPWCGVCRMFRPTFAVWFVITGSSLFYGGLNHREEEIDEDKMICQSFFVMKTSVC